MIRFIANTSRNCFGLLFLSILLIIPSSRNFGKKKKEGDDSVLRAMCLGTEAFYRGQYNQAERHFDFAVTQISAVWGDSPEARAARSLWYDEKTKPFKGEPYERMMAFYYRGLLFLMNNDFGNAQAAFRQSVMQDAFAEDQQNRADVVLPVFLQGWSLQAQKSSTASVRSTYDLVKNARQDFELPSLEDQPNVLLIVETGKGPRKIADGVGSYQLKFFRGKYFEDKRASYSVDGGPATFLYPIEDIYWQASTRGGRAVDRIIEGKVRFRETSENIGSVLTDVALEILENPSAYGSDAEDLGAVLGIAGIGAVILSGRAHPAVDTRYWDNLPDAVHVATLNLPTGTHSISVEFSSVDNSPLHDLDKTVSITVAAGQEYPQIVWISAWERHSKRYPQ